MVGLALSMPLALVDGRPRLRAGRVRAQGALGPGRSTRSSSASAAGSPASSSSSRRCRVFPSTTSGWRCCPSACRSASGSTSPGCAGNPKLLGFAAAIAIALAGAWLGFHAVPVCWRSSRRSSEPRSGEPGTDRFGRVAGPRRGRSREVDARGASLEPTVRDAPETHCLQQRESPASAGLSRAQQPRASEHASTRLARS